MQTKFTAVPPPDTNGVILKSGPDALVPVAPNSTDVFYAAAAALMALVFVDCGMSALATSLLLLAPGI